MSGLVTFIFGAIEEMRSKVVWPRYEVLQNSALLVIVTSFVFSVVVGGIDLSFKKIITWVYEAF